MIGISDITVVIPHINTPLRNVLLQHTLDSIKTQTYQPYAIIVEEDTTHAGAAATRNRGLSRVVTPLTSFIDDDDYMYPQHLEVCRKALWENDADIVYPWFDVIGGTDPLGMFGKPFDSEHLKVSNYIPITVVAKTRTLQDVGGFTPHPDTGDNPCEDWHCWLKVHNAGGKIIHVPEKSWGWRHNSQNTSGRGDRW